MKATIIFLFVALSNVAIAQKKYFTYNNDPLFPQKHQFSAGVIAAYTSINPPPSLIVDVTYGITSKFNVGLFGGTTGTLALYGVKINSIIKEMEQVRFHFRFSSVYYPERDGTFLFDRQDKYVMPWMLSMALADAEWKTPKGIRWSAGLGLIETHCIEDMKMWFATSHHGHDHAEEDKLIEIYHTVQVSASIPLSKRLTLKPEVIGVMKGFEFIEQGKYKVAFPVNPYLYLVYLF